MRVGKTGRKNVKAVDLVGTTYKGFSVLDCKRENNRTYLFCALSCVQKRKMDAKNHVRPRQNCQLRMHPG